MYIIIYISEKEDRNDKVWCLCDYGMWYTFGPLEKAVHFGNLNTAREICNQTREDGWKTYVIRIKEDLR